MDERKKGQGKMKISITFTIAVLIYVTACILDIIPLAPGWSEIDTIKCFFASMFWLLVAIYEKISERRQGEE
ncbi:MAG: hypothetical protein QXP96_06610 [Thermoproteota archaeon]